MVPNVLQRCAQLALACAASVSLSGCLISAVTGGTSGGVFSGQATVELQDPAPCTVNATTRTTTCDVLMHAALPSGTSGVDFPITLVGWDLALMLWDPLIVQVPATMSGFAGSRSSGLMPSRSRATSRIGRILAAWAISMSDFGLTCCEASGCAFAAAAGVGFMRTSFRD